MSDFSGSDASQSQVKAVVKWFNATKGFGFVQPMDGSPDAFLHVSVLQTIGRNDLPEGAELICEIGPGRKGLQVSTITSIESIPDAPPAGGGFDHSQAPAGPEVQGTVKFFNAEKGFGFVVPDDGGKDVFVSLRVLERARLSALEPDQRVRMTTRMGQKGPMAETVELD
ncbi:cold-shock protein [Fodinicurvata halophila]|uniref:Cold-shock protein n=1 Tax=Fodinicurvata halophila TaxID=1419723 RepID=A0ABV8UIP9_9PROT